MITGLVAKNLREKRGGRTGRIFGVLLGFKKVQLIQKARLNELKQMVVWNLDGGLIPPCEEG